MGMPIRQFNIAYSNVFLMNTRCRRNNVILPNLSDGYNCIYRYTCRANLYGTCVPFEIHGVYYKTLNYICSSVDRKHAMTCNLVLPLISRQNGPSFIFLVHFEILTQ